MSRRMRSLEFEGVGVWVSMGSSVRFDGLGADDLLRGSQILGVVQGGWVFWFGDLGVGVGVVQ